MQANYSFTKENVRSFLDDVFGDIMDSICETGTYDNDLFITVGSRTIKVPMLAETYEAIESALHETAEIWENDYTIGGKENA